MNMSQSITGTYGTLYYVADMTKSVQYYKEVLNLTPEDESPEWTTFPLGGGHKICLHGTEDKSLVTGKGILIANVTGLEGFVTELKKRGAEVVNDIHEVCENGFSADIRDANGITLSFFEYKG
jgi:predicted enzyme related to lactoylglutathione lyase